MKNCRTVSRERLGLSFGMLGRLLGVTAYMARRIETVSPPSEPGDPATNYSTKLDALYEAFDAVYSAAEALRAAGPLGSTPE